MSRFLILILLFVFPIISFSCKQETKQEDHIADKPLFRDPVFDGAADPVVIWNQKDQKWNMVYTNRRANADRLTGVTWVHGTRIGIAESDDGGASWTYKGISNIPEPFTETHWAPDVLEYEGTYHMYLTYVPGIFEDWNHPRNIIHLTSENLLDWKYQSTLELANTKVIDANVIQLPDGSWRMWYNNEMDNKSIYYADSPDLYTWEDKGKAVDDQAGEGPNVFEWKGQYWMVVDVWDGLGVYRSQDLTNWERLPENLLQSPGSGKDDTVAGQHPDIVVNNGRAYLFYFTHPDRSNDATTNTPLQNRRSSIQVVELKYSDGQIIADRDEPTKINLVPPPMD
jgi:sucrose-6-phosphate hydrolase SacC (GH32 family)